MGPGMHSMARWKKIVVGIGLLLVLAVGAALAWWSVRGREFLWSKIQPRDAALLEGQEIPSTLPPEAWAEDLDFLAREIPRRFPHFDVAVNRVAFGAEVVGLSSRLPELSRQRTILALMGIAALPGAGTGHTGIAPFQRPLDWGMYPYFVWRFDDGAWITLAGAGAEDALGAEILAVGGRPVDELFEAVAPFLSADNDVGRKQREGASLSFEQMLQALGVVGEDGVAELTLRREGGEPFTLRVEPVELASLGGLRWGRTLQTPVDTVSPVDPRPRARSHRLEWRPEHHLLSLQLNEVRDADDETLAELAERLLRMADEHEVEKLVIDLRSNGGGNNQLIEPLVAAISGHPTLDRRGVLYTLIGRRTFSAAGNLASALERRTKTRFAGERSGFSPNQYGDVVRLVLPRSKIIVRISTRLWGDGGPYDHRRWIAPSSRSLAPPVTHGDFAAGRDPVLEAVLADRPEPVAEGPLDPAAAAALPGRYRFSPFQELTIAPGPGGVPEGGSGTGAGRLRLTIRGARIFAATDLYPRPSDRGGSAGTIRFATDLPHLTLAFDPVPDPAADPADSAVSLEWNGRKIPLPRVEGGDAGWRPPIDLLRDGSPEALSEGISAFRTAAADEALPDSWTELEINRIGYQLLEAGRTDEAIEVFRLQTELFSQVANSFDSLGDAYRRVGDAEQAAEAYRQSLERDPGFAHSRRMLGELADG